MNPAPPPTPESLERARAAFLRGVAHAQASRWPDAEAEFLDALQHAPGRPSVLMNLGISRVHLGRFPEAIAPLKASVAADPAQAGVDTWAALATAQMETLAWADATDSLEHALDLLAQPGAASAGQIQAAALPLRLQLSQCQSMLGQHSRAIATLQQVIDARPTHAEAWSRQGHLWRELEQLDKARHAYEQALKLGADAELHRYYLAALNPASEVPDAPRSYVESLFDQYAPDFEDHLVKQLGYQGHRLLVEGLPPSGLSAPSALSSQMATLGGSGPRFRHALDLGCGTGLCGPLVRPLAAQLSGVDVSAAMLEQARSLNVYDALAHADIHDYLLALPPEPQFDLVLAADVFIYVGALERVFALLAPRLYPGAWFAFTVESASTHAALAPQADTPITQPESQPQPELQPELQLLPSLRYAHSLAYVDRLSKAHGLVRRHTAQAPLRMDQAEPLPGHFVYLQKAGLGHE